jgi:hypothetical protein
MLLDDELDDGWKDSCDSLLVLLSTLREFAFDGVAFGDGKKPGLPASPPLRSVLLPLFLLAPWS